MKFAIPEEYPTDENLSKLELFDFPIDVIIPALTIKEFEERKREIKQSNANIDRVGYWTLFPDDTYWLSAWQEPQKLERKLSEFRERGQESEEFYLVWDAEPPRSKPPFIPIWSPKPFYFWYNVEKIQKFIKEAPKKYNIKIATGELPSTLPLWSEKKLEECGLAFNYGQIKGKMLYTSFGLIPPGKWILRQFLRKEIRKFKDYQGEFAIGTGCTAKGAWGKEPIMSLNDLKKDLDIFKEEKVKTAFIYRLGGLNEDYINLIRQYSD